MNTTIEDLQQRFPGRSAINPEEVGLALDMHPTHVRRLLRSGCLPGTKIGERWFIPLARLADALDGGDDAQDS